MSQEPPVVIEIDRDRLFRWLFSGLLAIAIALVLLDAAISEFDWISIGAAQRLFNITREDGIPNFFSTFQMLGVGVVVLLITLVVKRKGKRNSNVVIGWAVVAGLMLMLGFDDGTKLHERVGSIFGEVVTDSADEPRMGPLGSIYDAFPSYTWQLVVAPVYGVAGLFMLAFLLSELPSVRLKELALLAIALFAVAESMDFIEGLENDGFDTIADLFSTSHGRVVHFSKSIEEFLEMVATTTFLFVFLKTLLHMTPSIAFNVRTRGEAPGDGPTV